MVDTGAASFERAVFGGYEAAPPRPRPSIAETRLAGPDVAVLVYDFRGSGVVRQSMQIARRAQAAGLHVEVWAFRDSGAMRDLTPVGVRTVIVGEEPHAATSRMLDSAQLTGALARTIGERRPAVLFSAGAHVHAFAAAACALARPAHAPRLVGRASNALVGVRPGLPGARAPARLFHRAQYAGFDKVIAVAEELGDDLVRHLGMDPARIEVIPNGVDAREVARRAEAPVSHPWFAEGQPPVVLGVGRLTFQKNFGLLIDAFALARRERPMRLAILGEGAAQASAAIERRAARRGVADDLWLGGFQANPYGYMGRAAVLALSSRWEGAGNVLLEALAAGCPVASVACPTGVAEILGDGAWGRIAAPDDPADLARAMIEAVEAPRESAALMARAAAFDLTPALDRYVDVLIEQVRIAHPGRRVEARLETAA